MSQAQPYLRRPPPQARRRLRLPKVGHYLLTPAEARQFIADYPGRALGLAYAAGGAGLAVAYGWPSLRLALGGVGLLLLLRLAGLPAATFATWRLLAAALVSVSVVMPLTVLLEVGLHGASASAGLPPWVPLLAGPLVEGLAISLGLVALLGSASRGRGHSAADACQVGAAVGLGLDLGAGLLWGSGAGTWSLWPGYTTYGGLLGLLVGRARQGSRGRTSLSDGLALALLWGWLTRALAAGLGLLPPLQISGSTWAWPPWLLLHGPSGLILTLLLLVPTLRAERTILGRYRSVDRDVARPLPGPWRRPPGVGRLAWLGRWLGRRMAIQQALRRAAYRLHAAARGDQDQELVTTLRLQLLALQAELEVASGGQAHQ